MKGTIDTTIGGMDTTYDADYLAATDVSAKRGDAVKFGLKDGLTSGFALGAFSGACLGLYSLITDHTPNPTNPLGTLLLYTVGTGISGLAAGIIAAPVMSAIGGISSYLGNVRDTYVTRSIRRDIANAAKDRNTDSN